MLVLSPWSPHVVSCPRARWWCGRCLVLWCVALVGWWLLGVAPCVGVPLLCRGCLLPWGVARSWRCRVWCAPALGGACRLVCACGYGREYEGVPHRPGVRGRRKRAHPSRDAARFTR